MPELRWAEFAGGEIHASMFQADTAGCFQQRVPLSWVTTDETLSALMARSRKRLDPASFVK